MTLREAWQYQSVRAVARLVAWHIVAVLLALLLGTLWTPLALLALGPLALLTRWHRAVRGNAEHVDPRLWLRRAQHPRLFALIDEATTQMGAPVFDEVEVLPTANAFACHRRGRHVVALGMPLLAVLLRWELLTIVGHEMGHVVGGDVLHPQWRAWRVLQALGELRHPLRQRARHALKSCALEFVTLSHAHEHRADGWGGFVAGRGAVEGSLRTISGVGMLWAKLLYDLAVLARHGYLIDNAFAVLRRAWEDPAARLTLSAVDRELERERPGFTHPAFRARAEHAAVSLDRLGHHPPQADVCARDLLADPEAAERGWTRFIPGALFDVPAERLRVIDEATAATQANLLRGEEARAAIAERAGAAALELPLAGLLQLVHDAATSSASPQWLVPVKVGRVERIVKLRQFHCSKDEAGDWIAWLIYEAVQRGLLPGQAPLGVRGVVVLDGKQHLIGELAEALVERRGPWEALLRMARGAEQPVHAAPPTQPLARGQRGPRLDVRRRLGALFSRRPRASIGAPGDATDTPDRHPG